MQLGAVGFETLSVPPFVLAPGGQADLGELVLVARPAALVEVLDAQTHRPIEGAAIGLRRFESGKAFRSRPAFSAGARTFDVRSGAHGHALVEMPGARIAQLQVTARGFAIAREDRSTLDLSQTWTVELARGRDVRVRVFGAGDRPAPGELVHCLDYDRWLVAGDAGELTTNILGPGIHQLQTAPREEGRAWLVDEPFEPNTDSERFDSVTVRPKGKALAVLYLSERADLTVRVNAVDNDAAGAIVYLVPESAVKDVQWQLDFGGEHILRGGLRTSRLGQVHAAGLRPGRWTAFVSHPDRVSVERFELILKEGPNEATLALSACQVYGTVMSPKGQPVAGARVGVSYVAQFIREPFALHSTGAIELPYATTTDANGRFRIYGLLPNEEFRLYADADGLARVWTTPFPMREGAEAMHQAQVMFARSTGVLQVRVINGRGDLVLGETRVSVYRSNPAQQRTERVVDHQVAQNGLTTFAELNEGHYHVEVDDAEPVFVRVTRDAPASVVLRRP